MLAAVGDLTRLELVTEAIREALEVSDESAAEPPSPKSSRPSEHLSDTINTRPRPD